MRQQMGLSLEDVVEVFVPGYKQAGRVLSEAEKAAEHVADMVQQGISPAIATISNITLDAAKDLQKTVNLVGAAVNRGLKDFGDSEVGQVVQKGATQFADLQVRLNPVRLTADLFRTSPLTAHAFNELDKFSGGMITSGVNVSDLTYRTLRGDPITKEELVADALFALKVAALVATGGAAAGGMVGNMVGNEVCKHQTDAKDACRIAFTVVGAAAGSYGADLFAEQAGEYTFSDYLSESAESAFNSRIIQDATKIAVEMCRNNQWAGKKECAIIGQIASDYLRTKGDVDWIEFLAKEAGKLGVSILLADAFPKNSPEHKRLIKNKDTKKRKDKETTIKTGQTLPGQTEPGQTKSTAKALAPLAIGAIAAYILLGD